MNRVDEAVPLRDNRPGLASLVLVAGNVLAAWAAIFALILTGQADGQGAVAWGMVLIVVAGLAVWLTGERSAGMRVLQILQLRAGIATAEIEAEAAVPPEVMERRRATDEDIPSPGPRQEAPE